MSILDLNRFNKPSEQKGLDLESFKTERSQSEQNREDVEPSSFISRAIAPITNIPARAEEYRQAGIETMNQPGLLNKIIGTLGYVMSPYTGAVSSVFGEPVEQLALDAGRTPERARFYKDLVEASVFMISPGQIATKFLPQTAESLNVAKQVSQAAKRSKRLKVNEFIRDRRANIDKAFLDSGAWINKHIDNKLSITEREALPFMIQKMKDVNTLDTVGMGHLKDLVKSPTPAMRIAGKKVRQYYDEAMKFLAENGMAPNYIEDYITQLWDIPKGRREDVFNYFNTNNPFTKKRKIPTFEDGIKLGLKPKSTDISYLLKVYDNAKIHTAFNKKFANELLQMTDGQGNKLIQAATKAPQDWRIIDHPALRKTVFAGTTKKNIYVKSFKEEVTKTVNEIKEIIKTVPSNAKAQKIQSGPIKRLEEVIDNALKARGMSSNEASIYLDKLRNAYSKGTGAVEDVVEDVVNVTKDVKVDKVINEVINKYPIDVANLKQIPVRVHPDIADAVNVIFGSKFGTADIKGLGSLISAYETVGAFAKKAALTGSFFHHMTLTESALGSGVGRKALAMWNPKKVYEALKNKDFEIYKQMPLAKDSIDAGMSFGSLSDVQLAKVDKMLRTLETRTRNIPGLGTGVKKFREANELWDRALWDYYHNNLKLEAYHGQLVKELKRLKPKSPEEIKQIKRSVADFVNNSFGGQQWEFSEMLGNPKMQQILHWTLLAPDWTISTLKQAAAPIKGIVKNDKALKSVGTKFWLRAALYNTVIAEAVNYMNTKRETGIGKFTWDNDPGQKLNIFIGYNNDDPTGLTKGTKRYLRTGKQFKEVLEWMEDPLTKLGSKLNPNLAEFFRQSTRVNFGSGFPTDFKDKTFFEGIQARALSIGENVIPFSIRPLLKKGRAKNFMFTWPTSKGMTPTKTIREFEHALRSKDDRIGKIQKVFNSALENNLDPVKFFEIAQNNLKTQQTYGYRDLAWNIAEEMRDLDDEAKKDLMAIYMKKGILIEPVAKELNKLYEDRQRVMIERSIVEGAKEKKKPTKGIDLSLFNK